MERAKIITMCGSLKFIKEIIYHTERLELEGNCVLSIIYPTKDDKDDYTEYEHQLLDKLHKQKIDMCDAMFVVNVGGYIGNSTRSEIDYGISCRKEIMYLEKIN